MTDRVGCDFGCRELASSAANTSYIWSATTSYGRPQPENYTMTYQLYNVWFTIRRHAPYHGVLTLLPALMCSLVTVACLAVQHDHALYMLATNVLLQVMFAHDILLDIPPSVGSTPRIGTCVRTMH